MDVACGPRCELTICSTGSSWSALAHKAPHQWAGLAGCDGAARPIAESRPSTGAPDGFGNHTCALRDVRDRRLAAKQTIGGTKCCGMKNMLTLVRAACLLCVGFAGSAHGLGPAVGCDTPAHDIAFEDGSAIVTCPANCQARFARALAREKMADSKSRFQHEADSAAVAGASIHPASSSVCAAALVDGVLPQFGGKAGPQFCLFALSTGGSRVHEGGRVVRPGNCELRREGWWHRCIPGELPMQGSTARQ